MKHERIFKNKLLRRDGHEFRSEGLQGGLSQYKARRLGAGVAGVPKYIIFASTRPKPDIVIDDAVNMNIRVVRYSEQCLVYDQPLVIEIEGIQHYGDNGGQAAPHRYAEMVAEDRRIRLLGYEVYRFGGAEFINMAEVSKTIVTFFEELFEHHDISKKIDR